MNTASTPSQDHPGITPAAFLSLYLHLTRRPRARVVEAAVGPVRV